MRKHEQLVAVIDPEGDQPQQVTITGRRNCETLRALLSNPKGISSMDRWAHGWRLSHYVYRLRGWGVPIATKEERAGEIQFGRYVLTKPVQIKEAA